jgi:hypothetical protein
MKIQLLIFFLFCLQHPRFTRLRLLKGLSGTGDHSKPDASFQWVSFIAIYLIGEIILIFDFKSWQSNSEINQYYTIDYL